MLEDTRAVAESECLRADPFVDAAAAVQQSHAPQHRPTSTPYAPTFCTGVRRRSRDAGEAFEASVSGRDGACHDIVPFGAGLGADRAVADVDTRVRDLDDHSVESVVADHQIRPTGENETGMVSASRHRITSIKVSVEAQSAR